MKTRNETSVHVKDLTFRYNGSDKPTIQHLDMQLTPGDRCLLVGPNGSGKSTLLRILAGKHLVTPSDCAEVLGRQSFHDTSLNLERTYIDIDWGVKTRYGCHLQADIPVHSLMKQLQDEYPERRDELLKLLRVDLNWRLHEVSEGQRRRIQIFLGLIRPFKILLLDDVAVSLDVVAREDLFQWLKRESMEKGSVIIYSTHIFDGIDDWPTSVHCLSKTGNTLWQGKLDDLPYYRELRQAGEPSPVLRVVEKWCRTNETTLAEAEEVEVPHDPSQRGD